MTKARTYVLLLACVLGLANAATDSLDEIITVQLRGFNYEISQRTKDSVSEFLDTAVAPADQIRVAYANGLLSVDDNELTRQLLFLQINAAPRVETVGVVFSNGTTFGYVQGNYSMFSNADRTVATCGLNLQSTLHEHSYCTHVYSTDQDGLPLNSTYNYTMDYTATQRYNQTITQGSAWTDINADDLLEPGIAYTTTFSNGTNTEPAGIAMSFLLFESLDAYLISNFGAESDQRVVFITTEDLQMVAASVSGVSYELITDHGVTRHQSIMAYDCTDPRIQSAGEFIRNLADPNSTLNVMFVHKGQYIQVAEVRRTNLRWLVVVVRPADPQLNYVSSDSTTFLGVCIACGVMLTISVVFSFWVLRFRQMKLWSYAHPRLLLLMLVSNMALLVFALVAVVEPTDKACLVRSWVGTLAVTGTCAVVTGKSLYQKLLDSPLATFDVSLYRAVTALVASFLLQTVLLIVQTAVDAVTEHSYYSQRSGELVLNKECENSSPTLQALQSAIIIVLCILGCVHAFRARNASKAYAESKGLLVVALLTTAMGIGFLLVEVVGVAGQGIATLMLEVMGVVWYVATMQAMLFAPRVFRQLAAGDLSLAELREMIQTHTAQAKPVGKGTGTTTATTAEDGWTKYAHNPAAKAAATAAGEGI